MNARCLRFFMLLYSAALLVYVMQASVTASENPMDERENVRELTQQAKQFLKPARSLKKPPKNFKIRANFIIPDYSKRVRRSPLIRRMKRSINRFNNDLDGDDAMAHLGETGTFLWLQGSQPIFVYGPDCFSDIVRQNKAKRVHRSFFGKLLARLRNRFRGRTQGRLHAKRSKTIMRNRIRNIKNSVDEFKAKLKERILSQKSLKSTQRHGTRGISKGRKAALRSFLHISPRRRSLMNPPAKVLAQIDDSYIHVHTFARPPESQSSLVRDPSDFNSTSVVQMRIKVPPRSYPVKEETKKWKV